MKTLYIPGLGGKGALFLQSSIVNTTNIFRKSDKKIIFFDPKWHTPESYAQKYDRLLDFNDTLGTLQNIWAVSAGASLAVRLCVERPANELHLVCGKVLGSTSIQEHYRVEAPAFVESVEHSEQLAPSLEATAICYVPRNNADSVIDSADMLVPNARIQELPALKHAKAIGYALLGYLHKV